MRAANEYNSMFKDKQVELYRDASAANESIPSS